MRKITNKGRYKDNDASFVSPLKKTQIVYLSQKYNNNYNNEQ